MTGKEALNLVKECYVNNRINLFASSEIDTLQELIDNELDELQKYKKAFDILKKSLNIKLYHADNYCEEPIWLLDSGGSCEITQEEYELLEEVLDDGKCN